MIYNQILSTDMERNVWQSAARVDILNLEMKPPSNAISLLYVAILSSRAFGHRRPRGFGSEIAYVFADCVPFSDLESDGSQQRKK